MISHRAACRYTENRASDLLIEAEHASGAVSKILAELQAGVVEIGSQNLELFSAI